MPAIHVSTAADHPPNRHRLVALGGKFPPIYKLEVKTTDILDFDLIFSFIFFLVLKDKYLSFFKFTKSKKFWRGFSPIFDLNHLTILGFLKIGNCCCILDCI